VPGPDPAHWLHRLTVVEWLAAATAELAQAEAAFARRATRPGITHARRAAGMAWNAVLIEHPDGRAGRSYMEHVAALAEDDALPVEVRQAARRLRDTPPLPPALVTLGRPDLAAADAARAILEHARYVSENG
jgi:HEPN domain-containing protein